MHLETSLTRIDRGQRNRTEWCKPANEPSRNARKRPFKRVERSGRMFLYGGVPKPLKRAFLAMLTFRVFRIFTRFRQNTLGFLNIYILAPLCFDTARLTATRLALALSWNGCLFYSGPIDSFLYCSRGLEGQGPERALLQTPSCPTGSGCPQ